MKTTASGECSKECFRIWQKVHQRQTILFDIRKNYSKQLLIINPTGIPELGIEHFEPLVIDSVQISKGSGSLTLSGGFRNLNIKGPVNATVTKAK